MSRSPYLPAVVILVGLLTVFGPPVLVDTDSPEEFPVSVDEVSDPSEHPNVSYENLSEAGQRAFRLARENNGSATVEGAANVPPEFRQVVETEHTIERRVVSYDGERYLLEMGSSTSSVGAIILPVAIILYGLSTTVAGVVFLGQSRPLWGDVVLASYLAGCLVVLAVGIDETRRVAGWIDGFSTLAIAGALGAVVLTVRRVAMHLYEE